MRKKIAILLIIVLVFFFFAAQYHEVKAEAVTLAFGSIALSNEAAAILSAAAAAGIVALTAVGAYTLYMYIKSKNAITVSSSGTMVISNTDWTRDINSGSSISLDKLIEFTADKDVQSFGGEWQLGNIPLLQGSYYLYVTALLVAGQATDYYANNGYVVNSGARINAGISVGGVTLYTSDYWGWVRKQILINVAQSDGIYINGQKALGSAVTLSNVSTYSFIGTYSSTPAYGLCRVSVSLVPTAAMTATKGIDYVVDSSKIADLDGLVGKALELNPPADDTLELDKIKDFYYVPALRDVAIAPSTDISLNPPADVPNDKIQPPSLSLPDVITNKFPFSLPWDFKHIIEILYVEPKRPVLDFNLNVFGMNIPLVFDFNIDSVVEVVRKIEYIVFVAFLLFNTPRLLRGVDT